MRCSRPQTALFPQSRGNGPAGPTPHHPLRGSFPSRGSRFFPFLKQFPRATGTGDHRSPLQRYETLQRLRSSLLKKKKRQGGQGPPGLADPTEMTASKQGGRKDARNASVPNFYERAKPQTWVWARRPSAGRGEVGVQRESRGDRCGVPPDSLWPERSGAPHQHPHANGDNPSVTFGDSSLYTREPFCFIERFFDFLVHCTLCHVRRAIRESPLRQNIPHR